jgi:mRNA-degrading endonuclease RelE of RelBE toxin-antitoxin system
MMHAVEFSPTARRNLHNLPEKIATACVEFIYGPLAKNPERVGKPLIGPLVGQYAARRGTYRVVYGIDDDNKIVFINRVDHRSGVYRP